MASHSEVGRRAITLTVWSLVEDCWQLRGMRKVRINVPERYGRGHIVTKPKGFVTTVHRRFADQTHFHVLLLDASRRVLTV
jgi:hypothetical protein